MTIQALQFSRCPFRCEWCKKEVDKVDLTPSFDRIGYWIDAECHGWKAHEFLDMRSIHPTDFMIFKMPRQMYFDFYA